MVLDPNSLTERLVESALGVARTALFASILTYTCLCFVLMVNGLVQQFPLNELEAFGPDCPTMSYVGFGGAPPLGYILSIKSNFIYCICGSLLLFNAFRLLRHRAVHWSQVIGACGVPFCDGLISVLIAQESSRLLVFAEVSTHLCPGFWALTLAVFCVLDFHLKKACPREGGEAIQHSALDGPQGTGRRTTNRGCFLITEHNSGIMRAIAALGVVVT
jgi:hypothetical protein